MEPICGPRLEIDEPTDQERSWIFQALQKPEIHLPLSCPRPPTQALFDDGRIETVERGERGALMARFFIGRHRQSKQPKVFFLDFGWSGAFDVVRDLDLSIPEPGSGMWTYLEANLMIVTYLFRHGLARRARWRIAEARFDGTSWFDRIGVRRLTHFEEPPPISGEPISKIVYELSPDEYAAILARGGVDLYQESTTYELPWRKLFAR